MRIMVLSALSEKHGIGDSMTQFAVLTERMVKEALDSEKGELVVERAPREFGKGWVVTIDVRGVRCVLVSTRTPNLKIYKESGSAVAFIERNNPSQSEIRVLLREATDIPKLRLPAAVVPEKKQPPKKRAAKQSPKGAQRKRK